MDDGSSSGTDAGATQAGDSTPSPTATDGDAASSSGGESTGEDPAARCGDGVVEGDEQCDGFDLNGSSCAAMGAVGTLACTAACTFDTCGCIWEGEAPCGPPVCGNGWVEAGEACDGSIEGVDGWTPTCTDLLRTPHAGEPTCAGDCTYDTSGCTLCGNGMLDEGEPCDGDAVTCAELGLGLGAASCTDECELDVSACTLCGNGVVDAGEHCDGDAVPSSCAAQGFALGDVACDAACHLDVSGCSTCGDGIVSGAEPCDPTAPGLCACSESCIEDAQSCVSVAISEILYAPAADPDAKPGQWIELHNPGATAWDLQGCVVTGDLAIDTFDVDVSLVIEAGGYATLGSGTQAELGFTPDFPMPIGVGLFNDGDIVTLTCDGVVIDTVSYDDIAPWPVVAPGTSIALAVLDASANDDGAAWCSGATAYGPGHLGTPGAPNDCP